MKIPAALIAVSVAGQMSAGRAQESLPFRPPAAGTVLTYNGIAYAFGATRDRETRLTLRFSGQSTTVDLRLKDLLLTSFRRIGRQKATFRIAQEKPLWPLRLSGRYRYSWRTTVDGKDDGRGQGEIRVFSGFDTLRAAGRAWRVVLIVKEQQWRNRQGRLFRSRQNLFYAPALGFYVKEERFLFRDGRALPVVVLTLKSVSGGRKG